MWTIEKPNITATETFNSCIERIRDPKLKNRLQDIRGDIKDSEAIFDAAAKIAKLYLIAPADNVRAVTAKEMEKLYDRHMARSKSRGRAIYDRLMIAAKDDICPFCGQRIVSTLDHSLPKASHPALAVTPINLIPCCKDCNHAKGTQYPLIEEDQFMNAYYDNVAGDRWLYAVIVEGSPPAARFFVEAPDHWEEMTARRVEKHFARLRLAKLYASQAGRQLQNMRGALGEIYNSAGVDAVRKDLERRFRGCKDVTVNSWEGALYQAAATSSWYCGGGFSA